MPEFRMHALDGKSVQLADLRDGGRPVVLILGSITCPMTRTGLPILKELYALYGDCVEFLSIYNREAHPGEVLPQPLSMEHKVERARLFRAEMGVPWDVGVDDLDGSLDRALGTVPNCVYMITPEGEVCFRALASNEKRPLKNAMSSLAGGNYRFRRERQARVVPLLRALGAMKETVAPAGTQAMADLKRELPLVYILAQVSGVFRPLPPLARAVAALLLPLLAAAGAWLVLR